MAKGTISAFFSKSRKSNNLIIRHSKIRSPGSKPGFWSERRHSREKTTCCSGQNNVEREPKLHVVPPASSFRRNPESAKCIEKVTKVIVDV